MYFCVAERRNQSFRRATTDNESSTTTTTMTTRRDATALSAKLLSDVQRRIERHVTQAAAAASTHVIQSHPKERVYPAEAKDIEPRTRALLVDFSAKYVALTHPANIYTLRTRHSECGHPERRPLKTLTSRTRNNNSLVCAHE